MSQETIIDIVRAVEALAPPGAVISAAVAEKLKSATRELLRAFETDGRLDESPLAPARNRSVELHRERAEQCLRGRRVLVTGGEGCVGSRLVPLLAEFGPAAIVSLDTAAHGRFRVDVRDVAALDAAFEEVQPHVVFHLAGVREPSRAEVVVREAIETNVFGARNVIAACERHGVERAVYSSTGKCFAYTTGHVYTASKKLAELQWALAARRGGDVAFAITRFTHVLENGLVTQDIARGIEGGMVALHGPDRYFNVQNLRQATRLLVNAVSFAGDGPADGFWSAADLGWPVNTLELALHEIRRSGRDAGIRFLGVPAGYDERFFRGQFDWSGLFDYHPLINALEMRSCFNDPSGTMIGACVQPFAEDALSWEMGRLNAVLRNTALPDAVLKRTLIEAISAMARATFAAAEPAHLLDVLWWGTAPAWAGPGGAEAARFAPVIGLLADVILDHLPGSGLAACPDGRTKLLDIAETFGRIDELAPQGARIRDACVGFYTGNSGSMLRDHASIPPSRLYSRIGS